jgi:hypothetical protein
MPAATLRKRDTWSNQHQGAGHQSGKRKFERNIFGEHKSLIPGADEAFDMPLITD